ncbi:phage tail protein [Teredinibacter sp. KSP-S5-2]|uniref:phage tail protein n=1 Tax=Teredinibacter sp. KSP-S5-2 TaxID=3034506 RepID=UPI0029349DB6|nr:phage tail protein [Teredinibacter sp. KSP-S5-2]WNO10433.1 phage tail protein [Teredinibacter sp. KSP-S5-2]
MINVTIESTPELTQWAATVGATENQIRRAAIKSLNVTIRWVRAQMAREVAAKTKLRVGLIKSGLLTIKASRSHLQATVGLSKRSGQVPLSKVGNAVQNDQGVVVKKKLHKHAFVARMRSGHEGIYRRKSGSRLPIKELYFFFSQDLRDAMDYFSDGIAYRYFEQLFEREMRYILRSTFHK